MAWKRTLPANHHALADAEIAVLEKQINRQATELEAQRQRTIECCKKTEFQEYAKCFGGITAIFTVFLGYHNAVK